MAVLTNTEKAEITQQIFTKITVNYTKLQAWAVLQAIEDWFETNRPSLSTAINTATAPLVLTAAQKKAFVAFWCQQKFGREGF